jgi:penicillin-binding protein 1A
LSILRLLCLLLVYGLFAGAGGIYLAVGEIDRDLPRDLTRALDYWPKRASLVYSADGELIGEFYLQKRILVDLDRVPPHVQHAFIAAEDQRFLDHPGFDLMGIARAAWTNWRSGHTQQGASTITQQVTRMLLLSNERSYRRKMREIVLSVRVERELTKREILHIYLNQVYLGHGAYGVEAAADVYFGKRVDHLTIAEGAMLAGLVQGPSVYSPHVNMAKARERQLYVLERMRADGHITEAQRQAAIREPLAIIDNERPLNHVGAPYFVEQIRKWATREFGEKDVLYGGLRIYTTLDTRMQRSAEAAVAEGLQALDRRIGFRGPIGHLEGDELSAMRSGPARPHVAGVDSATAGDELIHGVPYVGAIIDLPGRRGVQVDLGPIELAIAGDDAREMRRWKGDDGERIAVGDLVPLALDKDDRGRLVASLAQRPDVQGAMVVMDPNTGHVKAMVGGYDFVTSQFNRATQARRQIGSAMKPFIYAAAMREGVTHLDILQDAPVAVRTAGGVWRPKNYTGDYRGPVTLRTALAKSLNTVSVRLLIRTGLDKVIQLMRDVGIESPIPRHVSIALGTPDLSLLEVVSAYATFPSGGYRVPPVMVEKVYAGGQILVDNSVPKPRRRVLTPELAYLVVDLMQGVVERGTGRRALVLGRPAAGKTGTSTGWRDAWFVGYTTDLVAGVWVGRDDFTPIGAHATGGSAALPIWLQFMKSAHPATEPRGFQAPPDIVFVRANENTGNPASPGAWGARLVPFARGTVPQRFLGHIVTAPFRDPTAQVAGASDP